MPKTADTFAVRLAALRARRGLTLRALAGLAGLSKNGIHLLEHGQREPTLPTLQRLAAALGVSPGELIAGLKEKP